MKLQAQSSRLLAEVLQKASKAISTKNSLAILDNVLLVRHADGVFFFVAATSSSQLTLPAPLTIFDGNLDSPIALPVKTILPFISSLPDCTLTFGFDGSNKSVSLSYCTESGGQVKEGKANFAYFDGKDFPISPDLRDEKTCITLPFPFFSKVLDNSAPFTAKDIIRPQMNCICIDVAEDLSDVAFVASDGHGLIKTNYTNNPATGGGDFFRGGQPGRMLLPQLYFRAVSVFDGCEEIGIECDTHSLRFVSGEMEYICKTCEAKYPNYGSVIPRGNPYYVVFNKREMLETIKRVSLFGDKSSNLLVLEKNGMFLDVSSRDVDFSTSAADQVLVSNAECLDGFRIGVNSSYLSSALSAIDAPDIRMQFSDERHQMLFTADIPAPSVLTMCMPMVIDD